MTIPDKVDGRVDPVPGETGAAAKPDGICARALSLYRLSAPVTSATTVITSVVPNAHRKMSAGACRARPVPCRRE